MAVQELLKQAHIAVTRENWPRAWTLCNAALNEEPDRPEALYLMGATMRAMGNLGLAYQVLRKALATEQRQPNLWMTYAATLHDLNRWEEAREALLFVHQMLPEDPMPPANVAATYVQEGEWREALNWTDKALKIDPENYIARISANFAHLSVGRWKDAWTDARYLYGNHLPVRVYNPPELEEPMWDGSKGKTVVVQADQGLGDIIMYSQMLPQLQADCKEVILECAPRMCGLMHNSFPGITVMATLKDEQQGWAVERVGTDKQVDAHVHISYLGNWYRSKDQDFPRKPYLKVNPEKVAGWREWLEQFPRPWVGIAWTGGIQNTQTHLRSMALNDLAPVLKLGGSFFDLSYDDYRMEISRWNIDNPEQIVCPPINTESYENTVALIAALDDVVTVTTTVAHVCGALGRKAYVLTPSVPQWRYAYRLDDGGMIWYPKGSVQLYRQMPGEANWTFAVKRVTKDLARDRKELKRAA